MSKVRDLFCLFLLLFCLFGLFLQMFSLPLLTPLFVLDPAIALYFCYWRFCCPILPVLFLLCCFWCRRSIYFVVAVNDNVIVFIVVLVITVVVATSLAVVHINVTLLQLFFLIAWSHHRTEVQSLFFTECSSNLFRFILDVSLTAKLKWVPWSNLVSNHSAADYSALKYHPMSGCSTSSLRETPPLPGKRNTIYDLSPVHRWIHVTLLSKAVPLLVEINTAWHYLL